MDPNQFETFVTNHKQLDLLINQHKFTTLSVIKKTDEMTVEFIDWISPKYIEAFIAIYEQHYVEKQGIICGVLRASFLANQSTKEKMTKVVLHHLDLIINYAKQFRDFVMENPGECDKVLHHMDEPFGYLTRGIFENLDTEPIRAKKAIYSDILLEIILRLNSYSPNERQLPVGLLDKLKHELTQVKLNKKEKEVLIDLNKKIDQRLTKYFVIGAFVVLIILAIIIIFI